MRASSVWIVTSSAWRCLMRLLALRAVANAFCNLFVMGRTDNSIDILTCSTPLLNLRIVAHLLLGLGLQVCSLAGGEVVCTDVGSP